MIKNRHISHYYPLLYYVIFCIMASYTRFLSLSLSFSHSPLCIILPFQKIMHEPSPPPPSSSINSFVPSSSFLFRSFFLSFFFCNSHFHETHLGQMREREKDKIHLVVRVFVYFSCAFVCER